MPNLSHPTELGTRERRAARRGALFENLGFAVVTVCTGLFAAVVARKAFVSIRHHGLGWDTVAVLIYLLVFWGALAYLALPRFHRMFTAIYVPDYFIGRARTSDGLLGDPVNLTLMGSGAQIHAVMRSADWTRADPVNLRSALRIVAASVTRRSYPRAPVSPLFVLGLQQEFAYQQEEQGSPAQRHHVRFWPCPEGWLLPGGRRVDWLAAGTYDRAVGLSLFTLQVTHKIDSDVDAEREHIVASIEQTTPQVIFEELPHFTSGYHSRNGGGDAIRTDGMLPIIDVRAVPSTGRAGATRVDRRLPNSAAALASDIGRRPVSVAIAGVLILVSMLITVAIGVQDGAYSIPDGIDAAERHATMAILIAFQVTIAAVSILLAVLVHQGRNWARHLVLASMSLSLLGEFAQALVAEVPGLLTMAGITVRLLTIHALTSASARAWTHRRRSATPTQRRTTTSRVGGSAATF